MGRVNAVKCCSVILPNYEDPALKLLPFYNNPHELPTTKVIMNLAEARQFIS